MKNNRILGVVVWGLGLALSLLLLLLIPKEWTGTVWVVAICTILVYLLHLALWLILQKGNLNFHNLPSLTLSIFFLLVQTVWAIIVAFVVASISTKTAILVNVLLMIIQVFVIVLALISKNYFESINYRQKNHHTKL